jgi:DNA invertase Pin-like site-specific DNA recombinase
MSVQATITDLRRLYHHIEHGGSLQVYDADRIARGVDKLEQLNDYLITLANATPHQVVKDEINEILKA